MCERNEWMRTVPAGRQGDRERDVSAGVGVPHVGRGALAVGHHLRSREAKSAARGQLPEGGGTDPEPDVASGVVVVEHALAALRPAVGLHDRVRLHGVERGGLRGEKVTQKIRLRRMGW